MKNKIISQLNQHPFLTTHRDIAEICQPLFVQHNYYIMNFIRVFNDGHVTYLCDNQAWLKHYLKSGYPRLGAFEQNKDFANKDYVLWHVLNDDDPIVIDSRNMFNIRYGVTLIKKFAQGYDYFNFGTTKSSPSVQQAILNEIDMLEKFIKRFYEQADVLIAKADQQNLVLADFSDIKSAVTNRDTNYYLGPQYDYVHLTAKEIECVKWLVKGFFVPEIAKYCRVSPRTLEKRIENIKVKLQCNTQCEIGYLAAKLGIDDHF